MTVNNKPELSLIIPAYSEEKVIDSSLTQIKTYLEDANLWATTEVIVVAADAGDKTAEIAAAHESNFSSFILIEPGARVGKGRDVALGMLRARGAYRIFTDADLATPLAHIGPMLELLKAEAEVVIGIREVGKVHHTAMRRVSSRLSNALIQVMAVPGVSDTQCGFKGFTAEAAESLFAQLTIQGWGFDFELLAIAKKQNRVISQLKIDDWSDPKGDAGLVGDSQMGAMTKTLKELIKVRKNLWQGAYK